MKNEIWLLLDSASVGGIETHVLELARGLQKHYITVRVVFMKCHGAHPLVAMLEKHSIPYTIASQNDNSLLSLCKCYKPAIIHTHGYKAGIIGRLIARYLGINSVSTSHVGEKPRGKLALYDCLDRYTSFLAACVFSVSPEIAKRLPCQSKLIENFVDIDSAQPSSGRQIAFVGRLSHEKGPDIFRDIACQQATLAFHVYGHGPMGQGLKAHSTENMIYHGFQQNMNLVWKQVGLLLITSRYEGLPMAAIEAMARGIPVLAANVGALDSLIDHGKNGWLVKPGDVDEFINYLEYWQGLSKTQQDTMRQAAINKVKQHFSSEAIIPKYIQCYQGLTAR